MFKNQFHLYLFNYLHMRVDVGFHRRSSYKTVFTQVLVLTEDHPSYGRARGVVEGPVGIFNLRGGEGSELCGG